MKFVPALSTLALVPFLLFLAACTSTVDCPECVCPGGGEHLAEDVFDGRGLYTTDGDPISVVRFDFAGDCLGSGHRAYVVYRDAAIEVLEEASIDPFRAPTHVVGSYRYEYLAAGVTIEARRVAEDAYGLTFEHGADAPLTARCVVTDGIVTCEET